MISWFSAERKLKSLRDSWDLVEIRRLQGLAALGEGGVLSLVGAQDGQVIVQRSTGPQ